MKYFVLTIIVGGLLVACSNPKEKPSDEIGEKPEGEVVQQETEFSEGAFEDNTSLEILKELDICVMTDSLGLIAECSPKNFKIIPIKKEGSVKDAFILEVKAGILLKGSAEPLPPVRHVIVFERVNGQLVKTNGFRGDVIATVEGGEAVDLILALYHKEDETLFHCKYSWDGSEYQFKSVEGLDYGEGVRTLSESTRDEVTNQIYTSIMQSNLVF